MLSRSFVGVGGKCLPRINRCYSLQIRSVSCGTRIEPNSDLYYMLADEREMALSSVDALSLSASRRCLSL